MKVHEMVNVLNHCDPQGEVSGDIVVATDGTKVSISGSLATLPTLTAAAPVQPVQNPTK